MDIFKLVGSIFVDTEAAEQSLQKTDEKAEGLGNTLLAAAEKAGQFAVNFGSAVLDAGKAVYSFASDAAATADNIDKMSQRLGISREAYQELDFVLSQSGVEVDSFQTGMKTLLANMDRVTEGNVTAIKNFDALGVSVTNADGTMRSQEEVLWDTIAAFQEMETSAEKSRLAQELFGKQGQEIIPLLNSQAGGLQAMRDQAHELGLILDDEVIDAGVEMTDTIDQTKRAFDALKTNLGAAFIPIVTKVAQLLQKLVPTFTSLISSIGPVIEGLFDTLLPPLTDLIDAVLPVLSDVLMDIMPIIQEILADLLPVIIDLLGQILPIAAEIITTILPILLQLLQTVLPPLVEIIQNILPIAVNLLQALLPVVTTILGLLKPILDVLTPIFNVLAQILVPLSALITSILNPIVSIIGELLHNVLKPLGPAIEWIAGLLDDVLGGAFEVVMGLVDVAITGFQGMIDFIEKVFAGDWKGAWESIKKTFKTVWDGLVDVAKGPINSILGFINVMISGIVNGINTAIKALNKLNIDVPDWVPVIGGGTFGFNVKELTAPQIPYLAKGGDVEESGTAIVGEKGPEMLTLPAGARVTPLQDHSAVEGIDYKQLTASIVAAIKEMLPALQSTYQISPDPEGIFDIVRVQSEQAALLGRKGLTV